MSDHKSATPDIDTQIEEILARVLGVCQYDAGCNCDRSMLIMPTTQAIKTLLIQSKITEFEKIVDLIDNYKPDPTQPRFGSASGAMENAGWKSYAQDKIKALKEELT